MRWFKIADDVWISEREVNREQSRIREDNGIYYAVGENQQGAHTQVLEAQFDNLRDAKKWVRDCTGWGPNP